MPYLRGSKPEPEYGPRIEYLADRFYVQTRRLPDSGVKLQLNREDLPVFAKAFGVTCTVIDGHIIWRCTICGDLGAMMICKKEEHDDYYKAWSDGEITPDWAERFPDIVPLTDEEIAERKQRLGQG